MATATLTSKGQITLPRDVRASLGVAAGDGLDFIQMDDGNYAIVPAAYSIQSLKGVLPRPFKPVSLEDMEAAIEAGARGA
jgi:AbrB family looped-hinge helix DNA binding protein